MQIRCICINAVRPSHVREEIKTQNMDLNNTVVGIPALAKPTLKMLEFN